MPEKDSNQREPGQYIAEWLAANPSDEAVLDFIATMSRTIYGVMGDVSKMASFIRERRGLSKSDPMPADIASALRGVKPTNTQGDTHAEG